MFCKIFKLLLCVYNLWLILLKVYYKEVLGDVTASLARDFVQLALSIIPLILIVSTVNYYDIDYLLSPDSSVVDF
jgi:hypothetical protein